MREKPPIAFYNFLPLVSEKSRTRWNAGSRGKSCQDRLFTQGLIENAVSHRAIQLGTYVKLEGEIDQEFLYYAWL